MIRTPLHIEMREQLARYIRGEQSLETFADWFSPRSWALPPDGDEVDRALAADVDLRLAEFSDGYWTEDELRELLRPLTARYMATIGHVVQAVISYGATPQKVTRLRQVSPSVAARCASP